MRVRGHTRALLTQRAVRPGAAGVLAADAEGLRTVANIVCSRQRGTQMGEAVASRAPAMSRAVEVMREIAQSGPGTLSALARRTAIPKSSLSYICQALVDERLLSAREGSFDLGPGLVELAGAFRMQPPRMAAVGVTVQNLDNPFFGVEIRAIEAAAAQQDVEVRAETANQSLARQIGQIRRFVDDGADAIIVDAVDSLGVGEAVDEARRAGVVVVAVNVGARGADAMVSTDNLQAGRLIAAAVAQRLRGRGTVGVVDGLPVTAVRDRLIGFRSALRDAPGLRAWPNLAGDHSRTGGYRAATNLFQDPPDAVFAVNDPTALGVADRCEELGLDIPVFSVDGSLAAVQSIAEGGPIVATAAQDPAELGRRALDIASMLRSGASTVPVELHLPTVLIEHTNVAAYKAWA